MAAPKDGCVKPAAGPIVKSTTKETGATVSSSVKEEEKMTARVGQPAPDFEASAYRNGSFLNVKLSDFLGKWVVLCFYPGDFTFV